MLTRVRRLLRRWLKRQQTVPTLGLSVPPKPAETATSAPTPVESGGAEPAELPPTPPPPLATPKRSSAAAEAAPVRGEGAPVDADVHGEDGAPARTAGGSPVDIVNDAPGDVPASPWADVDTGEDEPARPFGADMPPTPSPEIPVESSSVTDWSPPSFDTSAPAVEPPAPPPAQTPATPSEQSRDEPVVLTDFSAVGYPVVAGGYAPPPGLRMAQESKPRNRWVHRRSAWRPAMTLRLLHELDEQRAFVHAALDGEPVEVSWPAAEDEGQPVFRVPEPDGRFFVTQGREAVLRTLDLALPGQVREGDLVADDFDRLELVRLIAITLDRLHRADVVTAGLGWDTFLFALSPRPALLLHRPEKIRRLGGEFLAPEALGSDADGSWGSPFDADRFQLAALAHRLLVSREPEADVDPWNRRGIAGLSDFQVAQAWRLWERSAGPTGTRPQAAEWMEVLGA